LLPALTVVTLTATKIKDETNNPTKNPIVIFLCPFSIFFLLLLLIEPHD
jgi:hypothetical protein